MKISTLTKKIAEFVYPKGITCNGCGKELQQNCEYSLCEKCFRELVVLQEKSCDYEKLKVFSQYEYKSLAKNMILSYKDGNRPFLSEYLAKAMAKLCLENDIVCDVFCFVPSHKATLKRRGYDAMAYVAKFFNQITNIELCQQISRIKHGTDQTKLNVMQRKRLVQDNFSVIENSYKGKTVLILDDLVTSGATLNECTKVLRDSGKAKKVVAVTFARAL